MVLRTVTEPAYLYRQDRGKKFPTLLPEIERHSAIARLRSLESINPSFFSAFLVQSQDFLGSLEQKSTGISSFCCGPSGIVISTYGTYPLLAYLSQRLLVHSAVVQFADKVIERLYAPVEGPAVAVRMHAVEIPRLQAQLRTRATSDFVVSLVRGLADCYTIFQDKLGLVTPRDIMAIPGVEKVSRLYLLLPGEIVSFALRRSKFSIGFVADGTHDPLPDLTTDISVSFTYDRGLVLSSKYSFSTTLGQAEGTVEVETAEKRRIILPLLNGPVFLGRSVSNAQSSHFGMDCILLPSRTLANLISRNHFVLYPTDGLVVLADIGSNDALFEFTNRTTVSVSTPGQG